MKNISNSFVKIIWQMLACSSQHFKSEKAHQPKLSQKFRNSVVDDFIKSQPVTAFYGYCLFHGPSWQRSCSWEAQLLLGTISPNRLFRGMPHHRVALSWSWGASLRSGFRGSILRGKSLKTASLKTDGFWWTGVGTPSYNWQPPKENGGNGM